MTLFQLAPHLAVCSSLLTACSSVEDSLAGMKEKAFGKDEAQLQLTRANPARFLPEGTDAGDVRTNPAFQRRLLARNNRAQNQADSGMPALELPPLPENDELNSGDYSGGVLPALDNEETPTRVAGDGEATALPPLPESDTLQEPDTSGS